MTIHLISTEEFIDDDKNKQIFYYYKDDITDEEIVKLHPKVLCDKNVGVKYKHGYTLIYYTNFTEN